MKNNLLIALAFATIAPAMAQNQLSRKVMKGSRVHAPREEVNIANRQFTPVYNNPAPQQLSPAAFTWTNFAQSNNMYGFLEDGQKPLHYDPYVKAVSFIHRKGPNFTAAPANNSGAIVARISTDWGANWDSTCIYSDANNPGRYPQGAIYSAPGNTVLSNAYVVGSGPALDPGGTNWVGGWFASKQLGAGNYNNAASSVANAMQLIPNTPPYAPAGKVDYPSYSFASTSDGKVRSIGYLCDDLNSSTDIGLRGWKLMTGSFNAGVFNWSGDSMVVNTEKRSDSTKHIAGNPIMAWSQDGTIGYVITIGVKANATGANRGYQPIVQKTTNSGASWALINGIDFSTPTFSNVLKHLSAVAGSTVAAPQFYTAEGIDATVDMNGKLHIAATIISTTNSENDSLDNWESFNATEQYHFSHTPGKMPYLYDFYGDGTGPWNYITVDSITSEGPPSSSSAPAYNENPWAGDGSFKARSDSRIQLGRTPDGKYIMYSWAESNPAFTTGGKFWNNLPEVKTRMLDVTSNLLSPTKINVTPIGTPVNGKAMFHFVAPVVTSAVQTSTSVVTFTTPVTVSNNLAFDDLSTITHWYTTAALTYTLGSNVGIKENAAEAPVNASLFPNPSKDNVSLTVELKENSKVEVTLYDVVGRSVKTVSSECNTGSNTIGLDVQNLSAGIYMVNIKAGNAVTTKKLIVE